MSSEPLSPRLPVSNAFLKLGWLYLVGLAIALFALGGFVWLADEVLEHEFVQLNTQVLLAIHAHATPFWDHFAVTLTSVGSPEAITVFGLALGTYLFVRGRRLDGGTLVAVIVGGAVLTFALKHFFHQARPSVFPHIVTESGYSFPSGHATMSFCLFGFWAAFLLMRRSHLAWRVVGAVGLLALAASIALSRLYLGVHWPTDILAGFLVATIWLAICLIGRHMIRLRLEAQGLTHGGDEVRTH